ncbi:MAG: HAMP domain-containing histidine kinase [Deltaproteobacteria bacterium]|nr:HAMP domain-containing histidine kinase [Deltaproteobacteria bacterium]
MNDSGGAARARRVALRCAIPSLLLAVVLGAMASFATAVHQTVSAGESQFRLQQRRLAGQLADRVAETLRRAEIAAGTLDLGGLPEDRASADRWLEARSVAYRLEPWIAIRVESRDHRLLAAAGEAALDHEHHGSGVLLCPRCIQQGRALVVRGEPDEAGRQVEVRVSLIDLGHRLVAPAAGRDGAAFVVDGGGRIVASATGGDIGSRPPASGGSRRLTTRAQVRGLEVPLAVVLWASASMATSGVRQAVSFELASAALVLVALAGGVAFVRRREKASIEARIAAERAAADADRLATIGVLASGVIHEIANPLACVTASLEFVGEGSPPEAAAREALDDARKCAERMAELLRDLKTFARRPDDVAAPVDVRSSIESALRMARHRILAKARVTTELDDVPPVKADPSRLAQVFLNLVINAAQALPDGRASDHEIRMTLEAVNGSVVAEVADTGPGMTPEVAARIFEPFFTTKPRGIGTGLGLAICRTIVTGLGGEITVRSEPGRGATFRVVLPAA